MWREGIAMTRTTALGAFVAYWLAGCSGVDIRPISPALEARAHQEDGVARGYVVYGPMVVVEVALREVCVARNDKGACTQEEFRCAVGAPMLLPDHSKPFLVDVRSGLGKAGVDLTIAGGWRLAGIKDQSDNSAILGAIEKIAAARLAAERKAAPDKGACAKPGLYRVKVAPDGIDLVPLLAY